MIAFRACVLIPTYNNARTVVEVARQAAAYAPVIVVDDGSTDGTSALLANLTTELAALTVVPHECNRGKGAALITGLQHARESGFTHAVTLDSDGQHFATDVPAFLSAAQREPEKLWLGHRDLRAVGAGRGSRFGCWFSNFWTWVETGQRLPDTQTGFRCYPVAAICNLRLDTVGYDFEVEVLVKSSWTGVELDSVPIRVRYFDGEERVSHMQPLRDFLRISWLNARLCTARFSMPRSWRAKRALRCPSASHRIG